MFFHSVCCYIPTVTAAADTAAADTVVAAAATLDFILDRNLSFLTVVVLEAWLSFLFLYLINTKILYNERRFHVYVKNILVIFSNKKYLKIVI